MSISLKRLLLPKRYVELNQIQQKIVNDINNSKKYQLEKLKCLCGEDNDRLIAVGDRYAIEVKIVLCRNCGLIRTDPYYSDSSLNHFYSNDYRLLYVGYKECNYNFFLEEINTGKEIFDYVKDYLPRKKKNKITVVEIGCGAGGILKYFQELGYNTVGNDYSNSYLEYGRNHGLRLISGDINKLLRYGKADLIILNHVLEHFKYPLKYLSQIRKILKHNGLLYIALPGIKYIGKHYRGNIKEYFQNAHAYYYCLQTLCYTLKLAGFSPVKGSEEIKAIFSLKTKNSNYEIKNISKKIYLYIIYLELSYKIRESIFLKFLKYIFKCIKSLFRYNTFFL